MTVVGWILVGVVQWPGVPGGPVPNYGIHTTLSSCETMKTQIESAAKFSSLRCTEASIHMPK